MAQVLSIHAIEFYAPNYEGTGKARSASKFIANTRTPALFQTRQLQENNREISSTRTGFAIDFIFKNEVLTNYEFVAGFSSGSLSNNLFELTGTFQDSIAVTTRYRVESQYFFMKSGLRRIFRGDKKLSIQFGGLLNIGLPVSARTYEIINQPLIGETEYRFFARQYVTAGFHIPIGIQLKITKYFSMALSSITGFQLQNLDGTPAVTTLNGVDLKFNFRLRKP